MITERRQREFEKKPEWQAPVFACKSHFLKNYHTFSLKISNILKTNTRNGKEKRYVKYAARYGFSNEWP